ncbi:hypothetical protein [Membranihabitans maritimus]|uniref:hypothetical protein n=1 Tax=Membranihabitans maritimus TaxID=2904244 RepID=UPI001F34E023|nr:hypothetical protein [Membranihabitans maritimus]
MENSSKTAIVIGATGLVGRKLVLLLLNQPFISKVKTFSRRDLGILHNKLEEHFIDFNHINHFSSEIRGDLLFSCMGTTLKSAGNKKAQYKVDYTYQYNFAKLASLNGVRHYFLVSAINANATSSFFYPKIKGQLEQSVKDLSFDSISIFRPSVLRGDREKIRLGEEIGRWVIDTLKWIPSLQQYRSISGEELALAMVNASKTLGKPNYYIYDPEDIWALLEKNK